MPIDTHASRNDLNAGCGLRICAGSISVGDTLAIAFSDNSRVGASVVSQARDSLTLSVNGEQKNFRAWTKNDDVLVQWSGPSSDWTAL
jgi:hypothetical protein